MYHNEKESGKAVLDFLSSDDNVDSLKREDIHFTSKLASNSSYDTARKAIKKSVKDCGLGYIDLFLLHSPYGGKRARLESWRAVEDAIDDGEVKIGGVSNYGVKHVSILSLSAIRLCQLQYFGRIVEFPELLCNHISHLTSTLSVLGGFGEYFARARGKQLLARVHCIDVLD